MSLAYFYLSKPLTFTGAGPSTVITKSMTYTGTGPLAMSNLRIQGGGSNLKVAGTGNFAGLTLSNAIFTGNGSGAHGVFIKQNGSVSNVSVTSCTFDNHGQSGFLIQRGAGPVTNVDDVTVTGSAFTGNGEYGFRTDPRTTNLHITNSTITNNAIDGLLLLNADGVTLDNVTITGNRNGILLIPLAATDAISNVSLTNVTVNDNTHFISGQYGSGLTLVGNAGTISLITATNSSFSGNAIHGVATSGAVSQVDIGCSIITGNAQDGIRDTSSPSSQVKAEHVYWGCPTGPNTTGCAVVSGNVDYVPYRASSTATCTSPTLVSIAVTPTSATLVLTQTMQFTATATYDDGTTENVTSSATWSSSVSAVASVSSSGLVTAEAGGAATITASFGILSGAAAVSVEAAADPLPPDPATVAPPNDPTKMSTVYETTRFLYEGTPRIQTGVAPGTIERLHAAVIRGRILARDNQPISGVRVTIAHHSEYGYTYTRTDGYFDMAANGGGLLSVQFEKSGLIPAARTVDVPWNDFAIVEDVVLIPYDTAVNSVTLGSTSSTVVRGSQVTDSSGTRRATLIFPPGTSATMTLPNGGTQPLSVMNVRATEFTVGANGPQAMPALLPPHSGYTYAVELSVDEAVAVGASKVSFDRPVPFYLENFLEFPAGGIVPVGYYDRVCGSWVASDNGRVVTIVAIVEGRAYLDIDGDGREDDSDSAIGTTIPERETLATLYGLGQQLWRVPLPHFSPWDCNWPYGPPFDAISPPGNKLPKCDKPEICGTAEGGSIIECEAQALGEEIGITGTSLSLAYNSVRVPGRQNARVEVELSGPYVPPSLKRIELRVEVGGHEKKQTFAAAPDLKHEFKWDQRDIYGRPWQGTTQASVSVDYIYEAIYYEPDIFAQSFAALSAQPGSEIARGGDEREIRVSRGWRGEIEPVGGWDARGAGLGGWTLSQQHFYNHTSGEVYSGDGTRRASAAASPTLRSFSTSGSSASRLPGGIATNAAGDDPPTAIVSDSTGALYVATGLYVQRISPDRQTSTIVAGNGTSAFNGDGIPALDAAIVPSDLAVGPDDSLYIADEINRRVRLVKNGTITTIAGNGEAGFGAEEDVSTSPITPRGIAVGPDGTVYAADRQNNVIRAVAEGECATRMWTIGGGSVAFGARPSNGLTTHAQELGAARGADLQQPSYVALGAHGDLYFSSAGNAIQKITTDGRLFLLVGGGSICQEYQSCTPTTPGGLVMIGETLYNADPDSNTIRTIRSDELFDTAAGSSSSSASSGDGGFANATRLATPHDVAGGPDGNVYFTEAGTSRIRSIQSPFPGASGTDAVVASASGDAIFVFNEHGRHERTQDALFGTVLYRFAYDGQGYLTSITDVDDNVTRIERNGANATAIVAPGGQRTTLQVGGDGFLQSVANPASEAYRFEYEREGLMKKMSTPRNHDYGFEYDEVGRLQADHDPAGGSKTLTRDGDTRNYSVTTTSGEGRSRQYVVNKGEDGSDSRTIVDASGQTTATLNDGRGTRQFFSVFGSTSSTSTGDERFGLQAPIAGSETSSISGLDAVTVSRSRSYVLNPDSSVASAEFTGTINNRVFRSTYDAASRTVTSQTAAGRTATARYDVKGRVIEHLRPGLAPVSYTYDGEGRLEAITSGSRTQTFTYDARNRLTAFTDPVSRTFTFEYDAADRLIRETLPGNRIMTFGYDGNSNITSVGPPDRPQHFFAHTSVDHPADYTPPATDGGGPNQATYNRDRQLTVFTRPDGRSTSLGYDAAGRLLTITINRGVYSYEYDFSTGNILSITAPDDGFLSYQYNGSILSAVSWNGVVNGAVSWTFDSEQRVASEVIDCPTPSDACNAIEFLYDDDNLLTEAGDLILTRDPDNGRLTALNIGDFMFDEFTYNEHGELLTYASEFAGIPFFNEELTRDPLGRITTSTESIEGSAITYDYTYDAVGRRETVKRSGFETARYTHDSNGNRLTKVTPSGAASATYDDQDRLRTYDGGTYNYSASGELRSKADSDGTTSYDYDELGNLLEVRLPNGDQIEYVIDAQDRRVARRINGTVVQRFLYSDQLSIAAEVDEDGNVIKRFLYGSRQNVPDVIIKSDGSYRIVSDHLGSPRVVVHLDTGAVVQRMDYDEWGNVKLDTAPGFQPFGYAGGLYDPATKLVRFGTRDYDARTGRWTAKEPLGFGGGGSNFYTYALGDPINHVDFDGLEVYPANFVGPLKDGDSRTWVANPKDPRVSSLNQPHRPVAGGFYYPKGTPKEYQDECVALTRALTGLPCTDCWRQGPQVAGNKNVQPFTAMAAGWDKNGRYPQIKAPKNSAIYISQGTQSMDIIDQYPEPYHLPQVRTIDILGGWPSNNSEAYYVITVPAGTKSANCKCE